MTKIMVQSNSRGVLAVLLRLGVSCLFLGLPISFLSVWVSSDLDWGRLP